MWTRKIVNATGYVLVPLSLFAVLLTIANGAPVVVNLQIISTLSNIKSILGQVGPLLSGALFIIAGVFYALGQVMPPDKRANFHSTAINIIIGAIVVGVLSVASTSLATASSHLLSNVTSNSVS